MSLELDFYVDDEGVSVDLILSVFGPSLVQCINLEFDSADEKMKSNFLLRYRNIFPRKSQLKLRHIASVSMVRMQKT